MPKKARRRPARSIVLRRWLAVGALVLVALVAPGAAPASHVPWLLMRLSTVTSTCPLLRSVIFVAVTEDTLTALTSNGPYA